MKNSPSGTFNEEHGIWPNFSSNEDRTKLITLVQNELQTIILHEHEATNREEQLSSRLQAISLILLCQRFPIFLLDMYLIRQTLDSMLRLINGSSGWDYGGKSTSDWSSGIKTSETKILLAKQHLEGLVNSFSTTHPTAAVSL